MTNIDKPISNECFGIATFSVMQCLLEKLVELNLLSQNDVLSVLNHSIESNQQVSHHVHGTLNSDAIRLLEQLGSSFERVWSDRQA